MNMPLGAMAASRPIQLAKSKFAPGFAAPRRALRRPISARTSIQVKAFKENAQLQDWRVKQMVEASHRSWSMMAPPAASSHPTLPPAGRA